MLSIRGVNFNWRTNEFPERRFTGDHQVGFIAQELREVLPEAVVEQPDGYLAIDYGRVAPLLVEGIKELDGQLVEKECRIQSLESEIELLKKSLVELQSSVARLSNRETAGAK